MRRTPLLIASAALLVAAPLAACGGGGDDDPKPPAGPGGASSITVHGTDALKFDKTSYSAKPGKIDVTYVNDGSVAHTLLIKNSDELDLSIGGKDEATIELEAGTYTLYCDIAGHEAAGMKATLKVG